MWYEILPRVLNMSLTASIIILFVCVCRLLLKKAPKIYSYALWSVVLFRLLCPVSLSAPVSLLGLFHTPVAEVSTEDTQVTTDGGRVSNGTASAVEYIPFQIVRDEYQEIILTVGGSDGAVAQNINQALNQVEEHRLADLLEAPVSLLTYLWMLGILVMLGRGVVSYIRLRHQLEGAMVLEKNIYMADHIPGPFVMGLWNPKIYLPSGLQEKEQPYIILHEQHHIRRGDHFFKVLGYLALSIHWFNPLVWIAFRLFVKDMEMSCDEAVLRKLGEDIRADYSTSLLQFAAGQKSVYGTPLAFGEGETKGRIRNLSAWKKPGRIISVVAIVLCVIAILFCFFNPTLVKEALNINSRGVHIPELTQDKLEALYQQEFDKHSDKLLSPVIFEFASLSYNGKIYTTGRGDDISIAYPAHIPSTPWDSSLADFPLEKICDVYGEVFIKPVYGDMNADGKLSDVYAWYDDASKVEGECRQGTIWKFGEYDSDNLIALTSPEEDAMGNTVYRLRIFYQLNDIRLETGKDLLDRILNPVNAEQYGVMGQPEILRMLDGDKPEDIYFLGDVYKGTVVTAKEVKNPNKYATVTIHEKEPYDRSIHFRDYGDGIIGYGTPEGVVIYIKTNYKSDGTPVVWGEERNKAEEIYAQVVEDYKELNRVIYLGGLKTEKEELLDENGMIYFRVLDDKYQSKEDIEELLAGVVTESYIRNHMSWVLGGEQPLFKEVNGELCIAMMDAIGIGVPNKIFRVYQFDETLLKVQGYNEEDRYFVSLVKQEDKWLIDELGTVESAPENLLQQENANTPVEKKTTISGSFTVTVRDVIPDYTLYDDVPTVAVVTEFQGGPFTIYVGEEIGRQLKKDETYVFSIQPFEVDETKEELQFKTLASIVQEYAAKFTVVDFRLAEEHETGLSSLNLTIE